MAYRGNHSAEDGHYKIYSELQRCSKPLAQSVQERLSCNLLSDLASCLLNNSAVFTIVSDLKEIQELTEKQLFNQRQKLTASHRELKKKLRNEQHEEMRAAKAHNVSLLKRKHESNTKQLEKRLQTELKKMDVKLLLAMDDKATRQQTALLQVGVPGFSITDNVEEIRVQMAILQLIQDVRDRI